MSMPSDNDVPVWFTVGAIIFVSFIFILFVCKFNYVISKLDYKCTEIALVQGEPECVAYVFVGKKR